MPCHHTPWRKYSSHNSQLQARQRSPIHLWFSPLHLHSAARALSRLIFQLQAIHKYNFLHAPWDSCFKSFVLSKVILVAVANGNKDKSTRQLCSVDVIHAAKQDHKNNNNKSWFRMSTQYVNMTRKVVFMEYLQVFKEGYQQINMHDLFLNIPVISEFMYRVWNQDNWAHVLALTFAHYMTSSDLLNSPRILICGPSWVGRIDELVCIWYL